MIRRILKTGREYSNREEIKMSGAGQFIQKVRIDDAFWSATRETVRREGVISVICRLY